MFCFSHLMWNVYLQQSSSHCHECECCIFYGWSDSSHDLFIVSNLKILRYFFCCNYCMFGVGYREYVPCHGPNDFAILGSLQDAKIEAFIAPLDNTHLCLFTYFIFPRLRSHFGQLLHLLLWGLSCGIVSDYYISNQSLSHLNLYIALIGLISWFYQGIVGVPKCI